MLQRAWLGRSPPALALWPLSRLYQLLVALRRAAYARGLLRTQSLPVPVVVVGNVVAGGAGKTPLTLALVRHLAAQGIRVGVVSRGYGRKTTDCRAVQADSVAADVGDEPLLIARRTGVPVFVASARAQAGRALLAAHPEVQLIVCDDGLQHLALRRDLELCVFDLRGTGNGWLLPAGPLREPWPRTVDFVLRPPQLASLGGFAISRRLADDAVDATGRRVPLAQLQGRPVSAVAGIAQPHAFFDMLRECGISPSTCLALPDHAGFEGFTPPPGTVLCTEKDAVKLWPHWPQLLAVPLEVEPEPAFWRAFDAWLASRGLSSTDGHQTA